eukprot:TRINITY_DN55816_c0_g1_i1.p1 TRINITY_DN55816_c0_g1~~TRINITY_DN55816_c0_g1_i1.p1  ORF type:complete len:1219 (-),score=204.11 TRINITY_DN55816_c0_g1_i1:46-3702(-)
MRRQGSPRLDPPPKYSQIATSDDGNSPGPPGRPRSSSRVTSANRGERPAHAHHNPADLHGLLAKAAAQAEELGASLRAVAAVASRSASGASGGHGAARGVGGGLSASVDGGEHTCQDFEATTQSMPPFSRKLTRNRSQAPCLRREDASKSGVFTPYHDSDLYEVKRRHKMPRYTVRTIPPVEITIKVHTIADLRAEDNQFFVDIGLHMDWLDTCLQRDSHYTEDYLKQELKLFPNIDEHVFNPILHWTNAHEVDHMSQQGQAGKRPRHLGVDSVPTIMAETDKGLWMRKSTRIQGKFTCVGASYSMFPFDCHALPLCLSAELWDSMGPPKLINPVLRSMMAESPEGEVVTSQVANKHQIKKENIHLGELGYVGYGIRAYVDTAQKEALKGHKYELLLFVKRGFHKHIFDLVVLIIMVFVSSISFSCSLNDDALAGRLSITLTVLLSLIAFTAQRPTAIQSVPYSTVFDFFAQFSVVSVAIMSICNVVTIMSCHEIELGQECSLCLKPDAPQCQRGKLGYTVLDDRFLIGIWCFFLLYVFVQIIMVRFRRVWTSRDWIAICNGQLGSDEENSGLACTELDGSIKHQPSAFRRAAEKVQMTRRIWHTRRQNRLTEADFMTMPSFEGAQNEKDKTTACVLDLGGGEVGFYKYTLCSGRPVEVITGAKLKLATARITDVILGRIDGYENALLELGGELKRYLTEATKDVDITDTVGINTQVLFVGITGQLQRELAGIRRRGENDTERKEAMARLIELFHMLEASGLEEESVTRQPSTNLTAVTFSTEEVTPLVGGTVSLSAWRVKPFFLAPQRVASFERNGIAWLVDNADLGLYHTTADDSPFHKYLRIEVSSWANVKLETRTGLLCKQDFVDLFLDLSNETTLEDRIDEAGSWFDIVAEEKETVTSDHVIDLVLATEGLLQAVIRHRLFVGSIAGGTSSFQLTVVDSKNDKTVRLFAASFGNMSASNGHGLQGQRPIFRSGQYVTDDELSLWRTILRQQFKGEDAATQWPRERRGIFVGIASMFYAAQVSGVHGIFVSKNTALDAIRRTLQKELTTRLASGGGTPVDTCPLPGSVGDPKLLVGTGAMMMSPGKHIQAHQQLVANLAIAEALIEHVLHEDAWIYFRREWIIPQRSEDGFVLESPPTKAVATWSLGWFLSNVHGDNLDENIDSEPSTYGKTYRRETETTCASCCSSCCSRICDVFADMFQHCANSCRKRKKKP